MRSLEELGYSAFFAAQVHADEELVPARVATSSRDHYELMGIPGRDLTPGELSGKLRHELAPASTPVTGDWVLASIQNDLAVVHRCLDRKSALVRRAAGSESRPQVVAANVDVMFIVTAADRDFNLRRLERYLAIGWESGARPAIVLNKVDLVADSASLLEQIATVAPDVSVFPVSAQRRGCLDAIRETAQPGVTIAFVGSSGVGKTTIVNALRESDAGATGAVGADGRGRHTTTRRELLVLRDGGIMIDTPGMREIGLLVADASLDATFTEIASLATECRFSDCKHEDEPGCAVRAALEENRLRPERLESYTKLRREAASAEVRADPTMAANAKRRWKAVHRQMKSFSKTDPKRRG